MTGSASEEGSDTTPQPASHFANTHWTVVLNAQDKSKPTEARVALEALCRAYWPPLFAFVRQQGHSLADAEDLTQEFFARLLEKDYLAAVDREKGRFRSFLLSAFKHFLANEWDKARAQKRGGGQPPIPIDARSADGTQLFEPSHGVTPETIFEGRWAMTVLAQVMSRLRAEYEAEGKAELFARLKTTLTEGRGTIPYAQLGAELGMSEGAIKVAAHRMRQRYRDVLRSEVAQTVAHPSDVEEELRNLFAALAG